MLQEIREILASDGPFAARCPGYEYRAEQIAMAEAIADAFVHKEHLLVEAGTGVGKTVAYLTPAILYAQAGSRVVVSTHTINLQAQLLTKDIPLMREVMGKRKFKAVLMKGRANFLCLQELDHAKAIITYHHDPLFEKLKDWAKASKRGDVGELDFAFPDWSEVCSNQDTCRRQECPYYGDRCFYYRMRRDAETADILVTNHSLFFSDLALRMVDPKTSILPDYSAVIFDEAHHLEDIASGTFGLEFSNYRVTSIINRIRKRKDITIEPGVLDYIQRINASLFDSFTSFGKQEFFFDELYRSGLKQLIEQNASQLIDQIDGLNTQLLDQDAEGDPVLKDRITSYRHILGRMRDELNDIFFAEQPGFFRWCEKVFGGRYFTCYLRMTPTNVADILRDSLWGSVDSVICTSATLSNSGTFGYIRRRLGMEQAEELILGSPFDFQSQALLYVPDDLGEPSNEPSYADALAARIRELVEASEGRSFLLFTSYRMLNEVFNRLVDEVPFRLLRQGEMSNERLLKEFREDEQTCLMGVHSFWEGVDMKGERLSCVIIDKLPFAVPDSPVHKARCKAIEREGGNWFRDYAIPNAQIRLKQGFGRLIRTKNDCGVVAILDSRIHTKYYGREFLRHLPHCKATKRMDRVIDFLGRTHSPSS